MINTSHSHETELGIINHDETRFSKNGLPDDSLIIAPKVYQEDFEPKRTKSIKEGKL